MSDFSPGMPGIPAQNPAPPASTAPPPAQPVEVQVPPPPGDVPLSPDASPEELEEEIRKRYPSLVWLLDIPEVYAILVEAARNSWGPAELQGRIWQTNWWKERPGSQREYLLLLEQDPASLQLAMDKKKVEIENIATVNGINLTAEQIDDLARDSIMWDWSVEEERRWITSTAVRGGGGFSNVGDLAATATELRELADQYLITLSDHEAMTMAVGVFEGRRNFDGFEQELRQRAVEGRFSFLADHLNKGGTVRGFYGPIVGEASRMLEVAPDAIDLHDEKWSSLLEVQAEDGSIRAPTLREVRDQIRLMPEWAGTDNAQVLATQVGAAMTERFGVRR